MAIFLETQDIYRVLQRELPDGAYPDGAPSGNYSTASIYAKASLMADGYYNMFRMYQNYFPQTSDEKQSDWEIKVFGVGLDGSLSLADRRDRVIAKLRARPGITKGDMRDIVESVIGTSHDFEIVAWGCEDGGGWLIGVSELGVSTILNGAFAYAITAGTFPGVQICDLTAADLGITEEEYLSWRSSAYMYSVLIYGYTLTTEEREALDLALTTAEPARSGHVIEDGLDPAEHV